MGEMAHKMNQMLDDIEKLNGEIIESNRKYLEMEYAKKQTEMIAYRSQINPHSCTIPLTVSGEWRYITGKRKLRS